MSVYHLRGSSGSDSDDDDIQICWQASQSNLLHQLAGTQMTRLPPPPPPPVIPAPPTPQLNPLNRKSHSFTRNNHFRRTKTRRTRSQLANHSSASLDRTGTDNDDSDCDSATHKVKKARIQKQNSELDVLIDKVSARLQRERSSNSSVYDHGGSGTASCSYSHSQGHSRANSHGNIHASSHKHSSSSENIPPQRHSQVKHNQNTSAQAPLQPPSHHNIPSDSHSSNKVLGLRKPPPPAPNQRFKPPQRVGTAAFPPQAQQRDVHAATTNKASPTKIKREPSIEAKPTIIDVDVNMSSASQPKSQLHSQSQSQDMLQSPYMLQSQDMLISQDMPKSQPQQQQQQQSQPPPPPPDPNDYSCDDFDMDELEQVCAQFD
ncbi:hypothetical protein E3P99_01160 [Wallemia hederae]|uniref:Uncharacterized protein n=1 Tax=Wallemia hederae TaxID=1540922 RepID=A0A4T0FRV9_9BASI|nr:hypothetical protein E3P99_01160 [Wallemia hederae]